ncbi:MAG: RNA pseudouridine synthase [Deltaproteobacteria bacterium]|nr:RNA pseudouridine synthase [Deltaproteobacteria bacterium]
MRDGKPGNVFAAPVHRLDRPATGLVIFAKTSKAASRMHEIFRDGRVTKIYRVVVEGKPRASEERLENWMVKDAARNTSRVAAEGAKNAKRAALSYKLVRVLENYSVLEVTLETGRSHQIRVQLAHAERRLPAICVTARNARWGRGLRCMRPS